MRKYIILTILVLLFGKGISAAQDSAFRVFTENNLQGLEDREGKIVIPAQYDQLGWSTGEIRIINGVLGFKNGNSWGLISVKNEVISPPEYTRLLPSENDLIIAGKQEKFFNRYVYGLINERNKVIIPLKYYEIKPVGEYFIASILKDLDYRFGLLDQKGGVIIPFQYFSIGPVYDFLVLENTLNKKALVQKNGIAVTGFDYDDIQEISGYIATFLDGKMGFWIKQGKSSSLLKFRSYQFDEDLKVSEVQYFPEWKILTADNQLINTLNYDHINLLRKVIWQQAVRSRILLDSDFQKIDKDTIHFSVHYDSLLEMAGLYFGGTQNDEGYVWNVHNKEGKKISSITFEDIGTYSEGLIPVKFDGFWGFMDSKGILLFQSSFQEATPFKNGLSKVRFYNQEGLIDFEGSWVTLPSFSNLDYVYDQSYIYKKGYSHGLVDGAKGIVYKTGNRLEEFNQMVLETNQESKYGLLEPNGNVLFETDYDTIIFSPQTNHYILKVNNEFLLFNIRTNRNYALKGNVQEVYQPTEGYFGIKANNKYGFVDLEGKLRISNRYDSIMPVKNEFIPIKLRGKWGLINTSEEIIVQPLYLEVDPVNMENIIVRNEQGYGILDRSGKVVINVVYDQIETLPNGHMRVTKDGKEGLLDQFGNILVPPRYERIEEAGSDHYIIRRQNKYGLITSDGISTIPPVYDQLVYDHFRDKYLGQTASGWITLK